MNEAQNTQVVKNAYAAFQRGDIGGVLATLDDSIEWHAVIGTEGVVPHAGVRRGLNGVGEFFSILGTTTDFQAFEPQEFIAQGDQVAVVGKYKAKVKPTAKTIESGWVMIFTFKNGKIARFREFTDSAQLVRAYQ